MKNGNEASGLVPLATCPSAGNAFHELSRSSPVSDDSDAVGCSRRRRATRRSVIGTVGRASGRKLDVSESGVTGKTLSPMLSRALGSKTPGIGQPQLAQTH